MYREADGPEEIRKAVREQLRDGADFIKVMTCGARSNELEDPDPLQLTDAELSALVGEAHRMGVRVAAHVEGLDGTEAAIGMGSTRSSTGCTSASVPSCSSGWPPTASSWCRP